MKGKLAIVFRYGAVEHVDFLPSLPDLAEQLQAEGWEVHHFGLKGKGKVPASLKKVMTIHRGPFRVNRGRSFDKWLKAFLWLCWLPRLGKKLQQQGFDKVFVDETLPLSAGLLRKGYQGWLGFTVHDFFAEIYLNGKGPGTLIAKWLHEQDVKAWKSMQQVFTRVEPAKQALIEMGIRKDLISVVPDAVDASTFHAEISPEERKQIRERWGIWTEDLVMVHHGIMHPNKGNVYLVEALFRLRHQLPELKLLLIGDGPEKREVLNVAGKRGITDRVICTGWLPTLKDISLLLRASDIGLVMRRGIPGDQYHVTSTLVHNLASGLPTVAVRLPGIEESVEDGVHAGLFDVSCQEEFEEWILRLARDPATRKQLGENGRRHAQYRFCPFRIAEAYLQVFAAN